MPRLTVSDRLRATLRHLLVHGQAAKLSRYSRTRNSKGLTTQALSYFVNRTPSRRPIRLDDLDDIADYFRLSIGELLGAAKPGELSGDEQRMVHSFRVLPPAAQDHFLAIIESMSVGTRMAQQSAGRSHRPIRGDHVDAPIPATPVPLDPPVRQHIIDLLVQLLHLVGANDAGRQAPKTRVPLAGPPPGA